MPEPRKKTAQQQINYHTAVRKLQVDLEDFVEAVERNGYKVRSVMWNYLPIYWANSHKRKWQVVLFGDAGVKSREHIDLPDPLSKNPTPRATGYKRAKRKPSNPPFKG